MNRHKNCTDYPPTNTAHNFDFAANHVQHGADDDNPGTDDGATTG